MRNLKKVLALALAFAMVFSVMSGAFVYLDQEEIAEDGAVRASVDILNVLKVMIGTAGAIGETRGYNFEPLANLKRNEAASVMTALMNGGVDGTLAVKALYSDIPSQFTDVNNDQYNEWYIGYVNYCAVNGIINGKTSKIFDPNGTLTTAEATAMLLILLGYDKADVAKNWPNNVISIGLSLGLFKNVDAEITKPISRQAYAVLIVNALKTTPVAKNALGAYEKQNVNMIGMLPLVRKMQNDFFSPGIDEYDQLCYKLFSKTIEYFYEMKGVLTASSAYAFKGAKMGAGQVRVDILANQSNAYTQSNIAYTLTGQSSFDPNLVGAMVVASYYGMISYSTTTDLIGGIGHQVLVNDPVATSYIVLVKDSQNYPGAPADPANKLIGNYNRIYGRTIDGPNAAETFDDTTFMTKNVLTSTVSSGVTTYNMGLVDRYDGEKAKTTIGMTNQTVNDNNTDLGVYVAKNGAAATLITDKAVLAATLEPNSDRAFDRINKIVANKDNQIVFADVTEYTVAKATVVGTAGKVITEDNAAAGTLTDLNFSGYTWAVAADKPADGTYDNLYIAYNAADKKIFKLAATRVVASSATLADGVVTVKDQNGNVISNYDPYVPAAAKIAGGSAVLEDYDFVNADEEDMRVFDIIRGPAGKVLAAYPVTSSIANLGITFGAVVSVAGAGTLLDPYKVMVLDASGVTTTYALNTAVEGGHWTDAYAYITSFIGTAKVFIPVSYKVASGKVDLTVLHSNACSSCDVWYSDVSGADAHDDWSFDFSDEVIYDSDDAAYEVTANTVVFSYNYATGTWTVAKASTLTADKITEDTAGDDVVVWDYNPDYFDTAKVWFSIEGAVVD